MTGGNTANMLALWRLHGLDRVLREAWDAGVVMAGMSAGAICWFESCTTDSFGPALRPLYGGLGILDGSLSPHYHGEAQRRPLYRRLVGGRDAARRACRRRRCRARLPRPRAGRGRHVIARCGRLAGRARRPGGTTETALPMRFLGDLDPRRRQAPRRPSPTLAVAVPGRDRMDGIGASSTSRRAAAVATVSRQPGGVRPAATSASGARTNRRFAASRWGTTRAGPPCPGRATAPPAGDPATAAPGRRPAGRGRARAGPSARAPGGRTLARAA